MDSPPAETAAGSGSDDVTAGVRLVVLNLPEDEGEGLGFRLTRTLWDPYPWVREVVPSSRADVAGLKVGDCLLQTDGRDLLGLPVGQVAGLIRGDGAGHGVSLLVWNCGVDPKDDPELLWSCGGGSRGERSRRALAGVVRALACCVCAATATRALSCARSHLYCEACWTRLERCALCRETLPAKDSPYARNLVAEQVFEAIATEYEIKDTIRKATETASVTASPSASPSVNRKGKYQISMMNRHRKNVHFNEKFRQNYASDPNIHRSANINPETYRQRDPTSLVNPTTLTACCKAGSTETRGCQIQNSNVAFENLKCRDQVQNWNAALRLPQIMIEDTAQNVDANSENTSYCCQNQRNVQHKLVTRLRQACSMADLQNAVQSCSCPTSGSMNNINMGDNCSKKLCSTSLDNIHGNSESACETQQAVFVLATPPIYVLACDHAQTK